MDKASDFLGRAVKKMKRPEATIAWLATAWPTIVGKTLALRTRPVRLESGRLEIAAEGKDWKSNLEPMSREFCDRINQAWGSKLIREVKFIVLPRAMAKSANGTRSASGPAAGPGAKPGPKSVSGRALRELDNEHLPFIRRRK
jgi:predicted nucleic acid-binding Zn ribbon protein